MNYAYPVEKNFREIKISKNVIQKKSAPRSISPRIQSRISPRGGCGRGARVVGEGKEEEKRIV